MKENFLAILHLSSCDAVPNCLLLKATLVTNVTDVLVFDIRKKKLTFPFMVEICRFLKSSWTALAPRSSFWL